MGQRGWGSLQCFQRAHGSLALSCGSKERPPLAGSRGRAAPRTRTQRGTYQLQRAETDERAAPGAAAHGVVGVPTAPLERDLRAQTPVPVTSDHPALRLPPRQPLGPAASFRLAAVGSGWGSQPPLLICRQGRRRSVRSWSRCFAKGPCLLARGSASWGG